MQRVLVTLLPGHRDGEVIAASAVETLARRHSISSRNAIEILAAMELVAGERADLFTSWLDAKLTGLAAGLARETRRWAVTLHDGGPRTRARSPHGAQAYVRATRPALLAWPARYDHLREVTRDDILACLAGLYGHERRMAVTALRSLFTWAKRAGVIFRNPATRIKPGKREHPVWQPLTSDHLAEAAAAAATPHARLCLVLAAVHAARPGAIRALHLAEVSGISEHTAIRYAVNARQLTAPAHQGATPASPAAPRPTREDRRAPGLAISGTELPHSALDLRAGLKAYRPGVTTYRVSGLAERTGLPPSTVRFYEQAGLVPARRSESGYRLFDDQAVDRIEVITTGKRLGLPLEEIRDLLQAWEDRLCQDVRDRLRPMVANQIASAERRAAETGAFIERLRKASSLIDGPVPPGRYGPGCGIVPRDAPSEAAPAVPVLTPRRRDAQPEPPIACTLTAADQADRIGEWRRLLGQADGREQTDGGLAFRFPGALAGQVAELAAAEQQCCPFLEFSLHLIAGGLRFEVRVPEGAAPLLADMSGTGDMPS